MLFRHGRHSEYAGLQVPEQLSENHVPRSREGRVVRVTKEVGDDLPEEDDFYNQDLGDSSAKE